MTSRHFSHQTVRISTVAGLATLAVAALLFTASPATAGTPSHFATLKKPIALGTLPRRLVATKFCADRVFLIDDLGNVSTLATLPSTGNSCIERYLAVSPGLGGFPRFHVYVVQNQTVYDIPQQGGSATPFVTIPSLPNGETGITFDRVGTFGFDMILTDRHGPVWTVTSAGVATQIADVGHQIEAPVVAPTTFAPYGGQLLVGSEFVDQIFAVSSTGVVSSVVTYDSPEAAVFLPSTGACTFGRSGGAYFLANEVNNEIVKFPATDFTGFAGALVPSELSTNIGNMTTDGSTVTITEWQAALGGELEGSTFFPCT